MGETQEVEQDVAKPQVRWDAIRRALNDIAKERGEWAGYPIPVADLELVMEPRFPCPGINGLKANDDDDEGDGDPTDEALQTFIELLGIAREKNIDLNLIIKDTLEAVNEWYCPARQQVVEVWKFQKSGRAFCLTEHHNQHTRLLFWMNSMMAADAWDHNAEGRAMEKLKAELGDHPKKFHAYATTGAFLETSPKSKVTYVFRRCRPTLALRPYKGMMRVIAALCLHPLGYYARSWAGVHCPTDDVLCHLLMMRGDEHLFWRKANQHPLWSASAGL